MDYLPRTLERKFLHMSSFFKAVLVTGARQVGKTTMLKHLAAEHWPAESGFWSCTAYPKTKWKD